LFHEKAKTDFQFAVFIQEENTEPPNEQLEEQWQNEVAERLSSLLQGLEETTINKSDVCPFDALSDVPVDDQRFIFLFSINESLILF